MKIFGCQWQLAREVGSGSWQLASWLNSGIWVKEFQGFRVWQYSLLEHFYLFSYSWLGGLMTIFNYKQYQYYPGKFEKLKKRFYPLTLTGF